MAVDSTQKIAKKLSNKATEISARPLDSLEILLSMDFKIPLIKPIIIKTLRMLCVFVIVFSLFTYNSMK